LTNRRSSETLIKKNSTHTLKRETDPPKNGNAKSIKPKDSLKTEVLISKGNDDYEIHFPFTKRVSQPILPSSNTLIGGKLLNLDDREYRSRMTSKKKKEPIKPRVIGFEFQVPSKVTIDELTQQNQNISPTIEFQDPKRKSLTEIPVESKSTKVDNGTEISLDDPNSNPNPLSSETHIIVPIQKHSEIKGFIGYEISDEEYFLSEIRPLNELTIPAGAYWKRRDKVWKINEHQSI